jgi:hypothetical protein
MKSNRLIPATLLTMAALAPAWGQTPSEGESPDAKPMTAGMPNEYGGVVTNQTITSLGYFFHTRFSEFWSQQSDSENYTLTVRERSSTRAGTEMQVLFGDALVFRGTLPRNVSAITAMAEAAAEMAHKNVVDLSLQQLLFNDPDMANSGL